MVFLLDVNVLVALLDPAHVRHDDSHQWFASIGRRAWATCPLTQNALLRILGNSRYPNAPGTPATVAEILSEIVALPGHHFWGDDISLMDGKKVDTARLLISSQITDSYLLALAHAHNGQLATFDRRLITDAVHGGPKALYLIG
jgi:toxin-antitoxin system PIN domain toxin